MTMEIMKPKIKKSVGIDLGKRQMEVVRLEDGRKPQRAQFGTDVKQMNLFLNWLNPDDVVAMEACSLAFNIEKIIRSQIGCKVILLNAGGLYTIFRSLKKTDKQDAMKIAQLLHRHPENELPTVSIPSPDEEEARKQSSEIGFQKKMRTLMVNRLHAIFVRTGMTELTRKDLNSKGARDRWIGHLPASDKPEALRIESQICLAEKLIDDVEIEIEGTLKKHSELTGILMSMPGIGPTNAIVLLGYLWDGSRFSHPSQVSNYAGLVPKVDCSGDTNRYGHITKRGCVRIRSVLIQAAWALVRSKYSGVLGDKYLDLSIRRGKGRAIVAIARKMLEALYVMVRDKKFYRFTDGDYLEKKLHSYGLNVA